MNICHLDLFIAFRRQGTDEEGPSSDKSLLSSDSVYKVDPSEVWKTSKG
jgi:hypothetical protein